MSAPNNTFTSYSPGVMSLIPLYYVGWADSLLSPSEVKLIQKKINELSFLSREDKTLLKEWSNPAQPPERSLFRHWVNLLRSNAAKMPKDSTKSMSSLGVEMAKRSAKKEEILKWSSDKTREALEDLERAIGGVGIDAYRNIFPGESTPPIAKGRSPQAKELTAILDDDYADIRNRMRTLLTDPEFQIRYFENKEEYREQTLYWSKLLADQGLGAISYPKEYGGKDDMGLYAAVFEMMGYHDLSLVIKFGVQFGLFGGSVLWLGTKKHHDKYLKDIGTLELPGCFAMTELGHGSNVRSLETTATYDHERKTIVINSPTPSAGKDYIGNAAMHGRMASVFAQLIVKGENHGVHAVLVPIRDKDGSPAAGVRIEDCGYKLGLNGVDNGRLWFDQVSVPADNLLNRFGSIDDSGNYTSPISNSSRRFFTMLGTLVGGRVCVPQAGLSAAKSALTIAIKYALKRRQFAPKEGEQETLLMDYPTHQRRLMPRLAKAYALDFALTYLTKRYSNRTEEDIREIETMAAGLKSYATWFTTDTIQECREACGGKGYLAENRFSELKADTDIFTTFEGDNTVLMQLVAKGLLGTFKQSLHDDGFRTIMKVIAKKIGTSITERNPIAIRKTDSTHLLDHEFHLAAFEYREQTILISLVQRMRSLLNKRMDPYDAFLRCQTHMMELANAYVENLILKQTVKVVKEKATDQTLGTLSRVCSLFALSTIEQHKGWYLENGYLESYKTKAIRRM
ncbi:MAG: acyl-CoA dehydrogenase, partial [Saprospiraceae bacterium]